MSRHPLIEDYLRRLRRSLPAEAVDELAGGLIETYDQYRRHGLSPDAAASAAFADFGSAEEVIAAFTAIAPGRRTARLLLATGPIVGTCWATALITDRALASHIPLSLRVAFGIALVCTIAALIAAARGAYRRLPPAMTLGSGALILIDGTAVLTIALTTPGLTGPMALAVLASSTRLCFTARSLATILRPA